MIIENQPLITIINITGIISTIILDSEWSEKYFGFTMIVKYFFCACITYAKYIQFILFYNGT